MSHPTLILVPSVWEGPHVFDLLRSALSTHGFTDIVVAPLRSTGHTSPNNPTLQDDIAGIRVVIEEQVKAGKRVVVVAHSAGGFLAAAATEGLEVGHLADKEAKGGVERFFFICAGVCPAGMIHKTLPVFDFQGDKMFCKDPDNTLFNDVPADIKTKYQALLQHQPGDNWGGVIPYAGWEKVPSMYLVTDNDKVLPVEKQEFMAKNAGCKIEHVPFGHMAILSGPEVVAEKLVAWLKA